jgi:NAD(P)-dependent dehydrogenase (short-subunit alcohol dehydrogenase family)
LYPQYPVVYILYYYAYSRTPGLQQGANAWIAPHAGVRTYPIEGETKMTSKVIVITGIGGMGIAIARRMGAGARLVLAEIDGEKLDRAAEALAADGYDVLPVVTDVSEPDAVVRLAEAAAGQGAIATVIHTAGLSPSQASPDRIFEVNLLGTALMLDAFEPVIAPGGSAVFVASIARFSVAPSAELLDSLVRKPSAALLACATSEWRRNPFLAYGLSKLGNMARCHAAAIAWGRRGARINTISPGIIATPMGRFEQVHVPAMQVMLDISPIPRVGTAEDIASAAEFLCSPQSSFLTGMDLLVDGGVTAAHVYGDVKPY